MKKLLPGLAAGLFIILVMFITKPTSNDFNDYIDEQFEQAETSTLQSLIKAGKNTAIAYQIKQSKEYDDKLLFATVSARELDNEVKYLGLMGMWFALN